MEKQSRLKPTLLSLACYFQSGISVDRLHEATVLIILFNLDNWWRESQGRMQNKGRTSVGSALVTCNYYLTAKEGNEIRRDISPTINDESALLCLDAVLFCRKTENYKCKQNTEAAAAVTMEGKKASVSKTFPPPTVSLFGSVVPACIRLGSHFRL